MVWFSLGIRELGVSCGAVSKHVARACVTSTVDADMAPGQRLG